MNRISRGYIPAGRNAPAGAAVEPSGLFRRNKSLAGAPSIEVEDSLDLFSRTRRGYLISSSGESGVLNRMEKKAFIGFSKAGRGAADEFLSAEIGKHDYDWLLTPPGTPLFSSVESTDHHLPSTSQRGSSNLRPASLIKTSRPSVHQSENHNHDPRMARSSSSTRASFSTSSRTPSSVLNTSSASVNSRPTTPNTWTRTSATPALRPTSLRPTTSRSTTPARARASTIENPKPVEKLKPATQTSRPSTPATRAHLPASSMMGAGPNSLQNRPNSRPSTPTRRTTPSAANSRPTSPVTRSRAPTQLIHLPDLPLDPPSNLRTKLPERVISAGRQRPGMTLTARGNSNAELVGTGLSSSRRASSPVVARGRVVDSQPKGRVNGIRDNLKPVENQKMMVPERKPAKPTPGGEIGGYGRTMSKNSLSMALKHMDIRQGTGGIRGATLFPHSIRSATTASPKDRPASKSDPTASTHKNGITDSGRYANEQMPRNYHVSSSGSREEEVTNCCEVESTMKVYGSSRYDSILLKEDSRSLNWLHSLDANPDDNNHSFDHSRFEPLPEPFILL